MVYDDALASVMRGREMPGWLRVRAEDRTDRLDAKPVPVRVNEPGVTLRPLTLGDRSRNS
jgi:hypothetical protein